MERTTTTIRAYDLGKVEGPNGGWRSFAFDLRSVHAAIDGGAMRFQPRFSTEGTLRFGDRASQDLDLTAAPIARDRGLGLQFRFNDEALRLANLAVGGFLYLDAWLQTAEGCAPAGVADLRLELTGIGAAQELAA